MTLAVYTFANEAYVPAAVALINSLRDHGFDGPIHVGSPEALSIAGSGAAGVHLHVLGPSPWWPGHRKAELVLGQGAERFVFLDADMVVTTPELLAHVDRLLDHGPVFAIEGLVSPVDHRRRLWAMRLGEDAQPERWPMTYFNSGLFGGVLERDRAIFERWDEVGRTVLSPPAPLRGDADFPMADQDTLNAVLQAWDGTPIGLGPPDVWAAASPYSPYLHVGRWETPAVLHCTGRDKPWQFEQAPDRDPHDYDLAWFHHVVGSPSALRVEHPMPAGLRAWFEQAPAARAGTRLKRLRRRLVG